MESKIFKILSIDGGGIKGLYSAAFLAKIEEKLDKKAGDCFDMICGTSTGGLIALGLACGKPASELRDLYYNHGQEIFPTSNNKFIRFFQLKVFNTIKQTFWGGKFSNNALRVHLEKVFATRTLGELNNLVCIPSFNLVKGMPRIFKYPHTEGGFFKDKDIPIVDAALATSAAPTYLPIHEHEKVLYVDGGVWANNPSLCGLLEAIMYFVGEGKEYNSLEILSVPTITQPSGWVSGVSKKRSFLGWKSKLIQTSMDGQAYFADFFLDKALNRIVPNAKYIRVKTPELSKDQTNTIEMARADQKALDTLKILGEHDGAEYALKEEIINFFNTDKTYKIR